MPLAARIGRIGRPPRLPRLHGRSVRPVVSGDCSVSLASDSFAARGVSVRPADAAETAAGPAPMMSGLDRFVRVSASAPVGISVSGGPSRRMPGRARILRKNAAGLPRVPLRLVLVLRPEQVVDDLDGGEGRYRTSTNTVFHRAIAPFHRPGSSMARSGLPCCDFSEMNPVCGSVHCRKSKRRPR